MHTTIIDRKDITEHKDGMLIKEWERGNVTMYMHLAKLDGKFSDIYYLEVTNLTNGLKQYDYTGSRPIVSDLNIEQFLNKYHGTQNN
jgi:hypothetical protein